MQTFNPLVFVFLNYFCVFCRYLFYLQLKNNVIDGLLHCTKEEAVDLASYILQGKSKVVYFVFGYWFAY